MSQQPYDSLPHSLLKQFHQVRKFSEQICAPLEIEDYCLQSMPETSPVKWHLAHTSWFFETFLLQPFLPDYKAFKQQFHYLFNSYYNSVGKQFPRPQRGLQSRPTVAEIYQYRTYIDEQIEQLLSRPLPQSHESEICQRLVLGLNHEQQHQELCLTDLKHALSFNPLYPVYKQAHSSSAPAICCELKWIKIKGGIKNMGQKADSTAFYFDNEAPQHQVIVEDFYLADRLVTNGEYLSFIEDECYTEPLLWLSDGWNFLQQNNISQPQYWRKKDEQWFEFTLSGLKPLNRDQPLAHISHYEADAFARWSKARLATEFEWETAASALNLEGNFIEDGNFHPLTPTVQTNQEGSPVQMFGDCWEWTQSGYYPYPGFKIATGAIGEYNGKFMSNQMVLRGGSCVTSATHIRPTYRNFFYANARWQFSGIRLAKNF